jgi:hypothetical protein
VLLFIWPLDSRLLPNADRSQAGGVGCSLLENWCGKDTRSAQRLASGKRATQMLERKNSEGFWR